MTFQEGGSFGGGRVRKGGGGKVAAGGGAVGLLVLAVYLFTGVDLSGVAGGGGGEPQPSGTVGECSAEQANTDRECRLSATIDSLDTYWAAAIPAAGGEFSQPGVFAFTDTVATACGNATKATGPFYCPPDTTIYLDVTFFDQLTQLGAEDGPLAEQYVIAHEYGHHIQHITGVMDQADRQGTGADSDSVRVELQADCYAGLWAGKAATTVDPNTGVTYLEPITQAQLQNALGAAAAVGDDNIQEQSGGGVNPDSWTHGSSEQRERWFTTGYEQGTLEACDTFATDQL
ncbi:KPN_02809 family neutral zinc metallopeptidase [Cellulomonas sp. Leaf395]|uniref:KPN_02809 family neutral zinc metallopeptidase n=1 Tax=Cellulomonas sp. Leaf395 TaxID=1736362 RepID=UPI0006FAB5CE|nr:neutral zinc metallopeptidase [Cellulomonas sp. Leaf395]KQS97604.1 neutral zinc metallopeptidase [Cellulomonas sp. Leaf395]